MCCMEPTRQAQWQQQTKEELARLLRLQFCGGLLKQAMPTGWLPFYDCSRDSWGMADAQPKAQVIKLWKIRG